MERLTTTSFGTRPMTYADYASAKLIDDCTPPPEDDKWALFRDLTTARHAFGVNDRDLAVLNALLTFLPGRGMDADDQLVVFPSNATLAERAHGMAESTMRRHLAALTTAGLLIRHDSPNGKRYAVRNSDGSIDRAFGLDLRPLLIRAAEIRAAATEARAAARRMKAARERASLHLRDLEKHIIFATETGNGESDGLLQRLADMKRIWRRKLSFDQVQQLSAEISALLTQVIHSIDAVHTTDLSGSDDQNEHHYHNSKPNNLESESSLEEPTQPKQQGEKPRDRQTVPISLGLVLTACKEISLYTDGQIRSWRDLCATASFVRGMLGISADTWKEAEAEMGAETAAIAIACILERTETIRSPGGYLRTLAQKAKAGSFSPGPMVMAILNMREPVAA
ncbi:MAG: plasmid replication protein RepC [Pikeienuella sp.]